MFSVRIPKVNMIVTAILITVVPDDFTRDIIEDTSLRRLL